MSKHVVKFNSFIGLLVLNILFSIFAYAIENTETLKFTHYTTKEGLSQNSTYSITQDNQGFIWVATQDGLNRFDGREFVQYRKNNANPHSIADNFIRKVFIDESNTLWVGTENGLSKYRPETDDFENYYTSTESSNTLKDNIIWDIYQDKSGTILVSTETGLHKYNPTENHFVRIHFRGFEDKIQAIKTIFQDEKNNYWLGTFDHGVFITNEGFSSTYSLQENNPHNIIIPAQTLFDIKLISGKYWLGTEQGLFILNYDYSLNQNLINEKTNSNIIRRIQLIENEIWLATHNGLLIVNKDTKLIKRVISHNHQRALTNNKLLDLYKDHNNNLWIASYEGINFINSNSSYIYHQLFNYDNKNYIIESITETDDKNIWYSSEARGLNVLNNRSLKLKSNIQASLFDLTSDGNNLWFTSEDGYLYNYISFEEKLIKHEEWIESNFKISSKLLLENNNFWFVDNQGQLVRYNYIKQEFKRYPNRDKEQIINITLDENKIWAITNKEKIINFTTSSEKFSYQNFKNNSEFSFATANLIEIYQNKWLWVGSTSQGVALIDIETSKLSIFDENNSLDNNYINAILLTDDGNAWCSTNKGISYINPRNKETRNFYYDFNLQDNEFIESSSLKATDGTYYFGGTNGIHKFNPKKLLTSKTNIATPILTTLLIANKKISIGKPKNESEFKLNKSLATSQSITLKHEHSPFSIDFVSPNNNLTENIRYRYRLIGLEENWIDAAENNLQATYTNLSSGNYQFQVQAYNRYQPEENKTTNLKIKILPPWWLSTNALAGYAAFTLLIIAYFIQQLRYKHQYNLQIKQSEERLKLSLWGSGDEMWDWNISAGKIYRSNIWGILEFPQDGERNIGGADDTNIHQADLERVRKGLQQHLSNNSDHFEVTYRVRDKNDNWTWILDRGKVVEWDSNDKPTRMTGTLKDISAIKVAEEKLKLFAKCIASISDAVVIYDRNFKVVDVNSSFETLTNLKKETVIGTPMNFSQYPKEFTLAVKRHLLSQGNWHGEIKDVRGNGEKYLTELNIDIIRDEHGKVSHFVSVFSDITKRKENEEELRKLANSDTLTGLPNRSFFQSHQTTLVNNKTPHALLVFDLDNFKKINDSMGHEVGDTLLCKVSERLLSIGRQNDSVYRLGGDEFSVIIEDTNDIHVITSIAKEILNTIALPLKLRSQDVVLYSSIGVVLYPEDGKTSEELLKNADTAMYHAKGLGGNKYEFFNESMNKQAVKRLQIENLIRHGLKEDNFSVFYQPKIEISSGKVAGMEALVRFETPTKGIISPAAFIPVSEETGQIVEIGEVVLRKSCFAAKKWIDQGLFDGRVAVNLSAVQFAQPNLVSLIAQILLESHLPAKHLELEITEGTVMDSPQKAIETMLQIRKMGIHLSIDDFGTGYSSLAYLKRFPINTLKIDKAFVDDIEESEQGRNMVATIVTIAHNLSLDVVAEGVENNVQLEFLAQLGCEQMQGYLYSKPLSEEHFSSYLLSHQITDHSTSFK